MSLNKQELLDKLFNWKRETNIVQNDEVVTTVFQKIIGDFDLQSARKTSLRYAREARKVISNPESDEYIIYIEPLDSLGREDKILLCLSEELSEISRKVDSSLYLPEPPEPEPDDSPEKFEEAQELDDTYEERRKKLLSTKLTEEITQREAELEKLSDEQITDALRQARINSYCDGVLRTKFIECCTYFGTFVDKNYKQRVYASFDDFLNLPENLKQQLIQGYLSLEMNAVNLKESQKTPTSETA